MTNQTEPRQFDEGAALAELERLAERIQASRRQREEAVAEFDAFVKTFREDQYATRLSAVEATAEEIQRRKATPLPRIPPAVPPTAVTAETHPERPYAGETHEPVFPSERHAGSVEPASAVIPVTSPAASIERPTAPVVARMSSAPRPGTGVLAAPYARWILAVAGLLLVVLVILWMRDASPPSTQAAKAPATAPAARNPRPDAATTLPQTSVPSPVASSGPARALNVQMVTVRPVWARVTVDGKKVIEREIPGGQTIPVGADRSITIRAGDAGALRLIVDGKDQGPLGRDGQPATRTLTAASR